MPAFATTGDRIAGWISIYSAVVFVVLWVGVAVSVTLDRDLPADAWARVEELPLLARLAAWVLFLPIMALLWISQRSLPTWQHAAALLGAVMWTAAAAMSLVRTWRAG